MAIARAGLLERTQQDGGGRASPVSAFAVLATSICADGMLTVKRAKTPARLGNIPEFVPSKFPEK
jgi:hypothetical protein